jgi:predicted Zn-dependent protease with MMP-like domain
MPFQSWFKRGAGGLRAQVSEGLDAMRRGDREAAFERIQGRYPEAVQELRMLPDPVDTAWLQLAAYLQFRAGDMAAAAESAERALAQRDDAGTWHLLGRLRVWLSRTDAASAFARAAALDPERYVVPYRVKRERFSRLSEDALAAIPEQFQALLSNTLVVVDDLPELESVRSGEDPDLLGLYEGGTVLERGWPERIVLYQRNHENICADEAELAEQVTETMRHEVGHHFGMAEDELPF